MAHVADHLSFATLADLENAIAAVLALIEERQGSR